MIFFSGSFLSPALREPDVSVQKFRTFGNVIIGNAVKRPRIAKPRQKLRREKFFQFSAFLRACVSETSPGNGAARHASKNRHLAAGFDIYIRKIIMKACLIMLCFSLRLVPVRGEFFEGTESAR
jgi:hypothetical protein